MAMDKRYHFEQAKKFNRPNCAYLHCEMHNGHAEVMCMGEAEAALYLIARSIQRIADQTDKEVSDVLYDIDMLFKAIDELE